MFELTFPSLERIYLGLRQALRIPTFGKIRQMKIQNCHVMKEKLLQRFHDCAVMVAAQVIALEIETTVRL